MKSIYILAISLLFFFDRGVKELFLRKPIFFQSDLLILKLTKNPNLLFWPINQTLSIISSLIILTGLALFLFNKKPKDGFLTTALILIIAGGLGNLYDRICLGYVIDYIGLFFLPISTFNLADMMISIGCLMVVGHLIKPGQQKAIVRD